VSPFFFWGTSMVAMKVRVVCVCVMCTQHAASGTSTRQCTRQYTRVALRVILWPHPTPTPTVPRTPHCDARMCAVAAGDGAHDAAAAGGHASRSRWRGAAGLGRQHAPAAAAAGRRRLGVGARLCAR
jgi:hypothetical protein